MTIKNTSIATDPVTIASFKDAIGVGPGSQPAGVSCIRANSSSYLFSDQIAPGETVTCTFSRSVTGDGPTSQTDTVTVVAADDDAGGPDASAADSATVVVDNVAPIVTITGPASGSIYAVGTPVTFTGTFTDPGTKDTHNFPCTTVGSCTYWQFDTIKQAATVVETNGSGSGQHHLHLHDARRVQHHALCPGRRRRHRQRQHGQRVQRDDRRLRPECRVRDRRRIRQPQSGDDDPGRHRDSARTTSASSPSTRRVPAHPTARPSSSARSATSTSTRRRSSGSSSRTSPAARTPAARRRSTRASGPTTEPGTTSSRSP